MPEETNNLNLDKLLDFKRAEKPSPEFWDGFQKEFRQRQLQTLIEKESIWNRLPRAFLARSYVLIPASSLAVALFVLFVNFRDNTPIQNEYYEVASNVPVLPVAEPEVIEVVQQPIVEEVLDAVPDVDSHFASPASFVMDVIPNSRPEALSYTREFPIPTSTIRSEIKARSALVSYTIARESPIFGLAGGPQTIGF